MKANLHPQWFADAKVTCACGQSFTTGSTLPAIRVEICNACHPFYTGTQKFVDTLGQVDRFIKRTETSKVKQAERALIIEARKAKTVNQKRDKLSLKELLLKARKTATS